MDVTVYTLIMYRFHIKCEPGQLLSYSVIEFQLEEETTCFGRPMCVDWVDHHTHSSHKLCGSRDPDTNYADGSNEMFIEFVSNRRSQSVGFRYFVYCIEPGFDLNAVYLSMEDDDGDVNCSSPTFNKTSNDNVTSLVSSSSGIKVHVMFSISPQPLTLLLYSPRLT